MQIFSWQTVSLGNSLYEYAPAHNIKSEVHYYSSVSCMFPLLLLRHALKT